MVGPRWVGPESVWEIESNDGATGHEEFLFQCKRLMEEVS